MQVEVSVILPFYNAEKTLFNAVQSILLQTFTNFELLLVDNNSTDLSCEIADNMAREDKRIKVLSDKRKGVANAMNKGLENSIGTFIARMDADDISHPERLHEQVEFLKKNPEIGLVGSKVKYISHLENSAGFERFVRWSNSFCSPYEIELNRFIEIPIINPTLLLRKVIYQKYSGCVHGDFPEDYEMQLRFLDRGVKMAKIDVPLLEWHDYPSRLTRTDERYSSEAFFRTKARYFVLWSKQNNPFHPKIWIWGAGRKTRQRAKLLEKEGMQIDGYIDVVKTKNALHYTQIPPAGKFIIVAMVANYGAREQIINFLIDKGYKNGKDFCLMA